MTDPDPLAGVSLTRWASAFIGWDAPYVVGPTYARSPHATFEFKAGATGYTGGGYPRVRSVERGPESGYGSGDVFVSVHRLIAVARLYGPEWAIGDIQRDMVGKDVHHELGMPSANLPGHLSLRDHGEHSEITQAKKVAWAKDAMEEAERLEQQPIGGVDTCVECGSEADTFATWGAAEGRYCIECATTHAPDGETIEIL